MHYKNEIQWIQAHRTNKKEQSQAQFYFKSNTKKKQCHISSRAASLKKKKQSETYPSKLSLTSPRSESRDGNGRLGGCVSASGTSS